MNLNYSDFIELQISISDNICSFLVDTQADISIIKESSLNDDIFIDETEKIRIRGITKDAMDSIGITYADIFFDDILLEHKLHIVPNSFNIPCDGIIGKDFIKNYKCKIDYDANTITFTVGNHLITLPLLQEPDMNTIILPARCEVIRKITLQNTNDIQIIDSQQIEEDVFIARTLVDPTKPYVKILNTSENIKVLKNVKFSTENLNDYYVYSITYNNNPERINELQKILSNSTSNEFYGDMTKLFEKYSDIFALEQDKMTINNFYNQNFNLLDKSPVFVKNYRLPETQKTEIDRQVQNLLDNNLIEPSSSSYNSPIILVPKKSTDNTKKWRMCIDYRMLNKKLSPDKFPLPRIDEILDQLGRTKYFSILDLYSGFHQIPIEKESRAITAFSTSNGSFQWKVLPFGLNVAPNSFMRMMNIAFSGLNAHQAFIYMDDIIVIGCSKNHHVKNLISVFDTCRKYNLKLNPLKCKFFKNEVNFLGHRCTANGILPDKSKIDAVRNYTRPTDKDATKRFVAFANYYRKFLRNFAEMASPLNNLTRKNTDFVWTDNCEKSFQKIKEKLISPPILQYPDFAKQFIVTVDASNTACGAVLSQIKDKGDDLPISFISKAFQKGEKNKPTIEKELIAIHFAITTFRPYLYGTHFLVKSDHKPLIYLYKKKNPASKLTNIRLDLEEYDFIITHISGKDNVVADALSRITLRDIKETFSTEDDKTVLPMQTRSMTRNRDNTTISDEIDKNIEKTRIKNKSPERTPKIYENNGTKYEKGIPIIKTNKNKLRALKSNKLLFTVDLDYEINNKQSIEKLPKTIERISNETKIKNLQLPTNDELFTKMTIEELKHIGNNVLKDIQIELIHYPKTITDDREKLEIIQKFHDDPIMGGHCGFDRLLAKIKTHYFWKKMSKDTLKYTKTCHKCQVNKPKTKTIEPLTLTNTAQKPFDVVIIDTIGPMTKSTNNNVYAVTIICDLTKYLVTIPVPTKEAIVIARAIFNKFVLIYGPMAEIRTDMGTEYRNEIVKNLLQLIGTKHSMSTAYRHETVGSIERNHRIFNEYLRSYLNDNDSDWDEYLYYYTFCYNTTPSSCFNFKYTPYELIFSKISNIPDKIFNGKVDPIYNIDNFANEAKFRLQKTHLEAKKLIEKMKTQNKSNFDKKLNPISIEIGDKVLIEMGNRTKTDPIYKGPYTVINIENLNVTLKNDKSDKIEKVHKNRLQKYHT